MLLQRIKDTLFWKTQFNNIWDSHLRCYSKARSFFLLEELDKQKYYWREEKGQQHKYSPRLAVYIAYKELADKWYKENKKRKEEDILEVAYILEQIYPFIDENGNYQDVKVNLDEPWKGYAEKRWENYREKKKKEENFYRELQSYRFKNEEINAAWLKLKSGNIPIISQKVWQASFPRKSAKDIIDETNVSIHDFVFWICVFKEYLDYYEEVISGHNMYIRSREQESLEIAISACE